MGVEFSGMKSSGLGCCSLVLVFKQCTLKLKKKGGGGATSQGPVLPTPPLVCTGALGTSADPGRWLATSGP